MNYRNRIISVFLHILVGGKDDYGSEVCIHSYSK